MRILAIDPGYERCGIALLEKLPRQKEKLLFSICFKTSATLPFPERLHLIGEMIEALISEYKPSLFAIERLYFNSNQKTAMMVAEVRGALLYIAKKADLTICEYTPLQIKSAVAGHGYADKRQIMSILPRLIVIEKPIKHDDEYDAIAIGLTCSASERF